MARAGLHRRDHSTDAEGVGTSPMTQLLDRPAFAAVFAIWSHTRSRFSATSAMQNCRAKLALNASQMGAPPANSFVPTGDALAPYNQIANTPKNQKIS